MRQRVPSFSRHRHAREERAVHHCNAESPQALGHVYDADFGDLRLEVQHRYLARAKERVRSGIGHDEYASRRHGAGSSRELCPVSAQVYAVDSRLGHQAQRPGARQQGLQLRANLLRVESRLADQEGSLDSVRIE